MATKAIAGGVSFPGGVSTRGACPRTSLSGAVTDFEDSPFRSIEGVITSAQLLALNTTPIELVPAPGAGKVAAYLGAVFIHDFGTAGYANGAVLIVKQENASGVAVSDSVAAALLTTAADRIAASIPIVAVPMIANKALVLTTATAFITGDGVLRFRVLYATYDTGL